MLLLLFQPLLFWWRFCGGRCCFLCWEQLSHRKPHGYGTPSFFWLKMSCHEHSKPQPLLRQHHIVCDVVDKVSKCESNTAPPLSCRCRQIQHCYCNLLQSINKNDLPLQCHYCPLLDMHTTDMMCWARMFLPMMSNLAPVVVGVVDGCVAILANYGKLRTSTKSWSECEFIHM